MMIALIVTFFKFNLVMVGFISITYVFFYLSQKAIIYIGDRSSNPFQRFRIRLSKVLRLLFKDILASFMGTLVLIYNADQDDMFPDLTEPSSPYRKTPCEILPMSPKELKSPVPVVPVIHPRRRNARIMLPRLIQNPIPVPS